MSRQIFKKSIISGVSHKPNFFDRKVHPFSPLHLSTIGVCFLRPRFPPELDFIAKVFSFFSAKISSTKMIPTSISETCSDNDSDEYFRVGTRKHNCSKPLVFGVLSVRCVPAYIVAAKANSACPMKHRGGTQWWFSQQPIEGDNTRRWKSSVREKKAFRCLIIID